MKPGDYAYNVQHLVEDFGADRDNLNYDESRKRDVPVHFNLPLALTGKFVPFLYDENALRESQFHTSRYFNLDVVKYFAKEEHNQKVERKFRRREPWSIKEEWVPLSSRPFTSDDEMVKDLKIYFFCFAALKTGNEYILGLNFLIYFNFINDFN